MGMELEHQPLQLQSKLDFKLWCSYNLALGKQQQVVRLEEFCFHKSVGSS